MTNNIPNSETLLRVDKIRYYLDYVQNHLQYIDLAYGLVRDILQKDNYWKQYLPRLLEDVSNHDLSKLEGKEFQHYRRKHFPTEKELNIEGLDIDENYNIAKEIHTKHNHHHWQTAENINDILHLLVDWTAKSIESIENGKYDTPMMYYLSDTEPVEMKEDLLMPMLQLFAMIEPQLYEIAVDAGVITEGDNNSSWLYEELS